MKKLIDYEEQYNKERLDAEHSIGKWLEGCRIDTITYHKLILSMPIYFHFEPLLKIPGYTYTGQLWHKPKKPKEKKGCKYPPPITQYRTYYFRNNMTGNTVEISESSKRNYPYELMQWTNIWNSHFHNTNKRTYRKNLNKFLRDMMTPNKDEVLPYYVMKVSFNSEKENVHVNDIASFAISIMKYYFSKIDSLQKSIFFDKNDPTYADLLKPKALEVFYAEPCIDIGGRKEAIDFMHKNFYDNLYMTRCLNREPFAKDKDGGKPTKDSRRLLYRNPTHYISKRIRIYQYQKNKRFALRFEFRFDKDFLKGRHGNELSEFEANVRPYEIWQNRCFFFMFDLPKIYRKLYAKHPSLFHKAVKLINDDSKTAWEKVRELHDYSIDDKKVFRSAREFLSPKWLTLHKLMGDALNQLSILKAPDKEVSVTTTMPDERYSKKSQLDSRVKLAVARIKARGEKVSRSSVMKETGIRSCGTISRRIHLLK